MDREELDILLQVFGHVGIQTAEFLKVLADPRFLLIILFQDALGNNISGILLLNDHLFKSLMDLVERARNKRKAGIVKELFLHAANYTKMGIGADFAELS